MKRCLLFAFFCLLGQFSTVVAQPIAGVTVDPPQLNSPSAFLSDWSSRASTATVIIRNNSGADFNAKVWVEFFLNGERVAYTQSEKLPFTSIHVGDNFFNGEQLTPLSTVHFEQQVDQNSQRSGRIPNGQVCIRVNVLEPTSGRQSISPLGCSVIISYFPPQLLIPEADAALCKLGQNNVIFTTDGRPLPLFQWTPIAPAPTYPVRYHFGIFEIVPNQEPIAAIRGNRPLFQTDLQGLTSLLWPTQYFLPERGKFYIWSVRALDEKGLPFIQSNDGWAKPFRFSVKADCDINSLSGLSSDLNGGIDITKSRLIVGGKPIGTTDYDPSPANQENEIKLNLLPADGSVFDWIAGSLSMNFLRKSGELQAADFNRDERHVREFKDALLTEIGFPACDGSAKDPAYIRIKFEPTSTQYRKGSGKIENPVDVHQKQWTPANFRLAIEGLDIKKVSKIDAITIKQTTRSRDDSLRLDCSDLRITVSEEYAHDFWAWHEDFVIAGNNDDAKHKNGSLEYLDQDRRMSLMTLDFTGIGIFAMERNPKSKESPASVTIVLRPKTVKIKPPHPIRQN